MSTAKVHPIRLARQRKKLTQGQLAESMNVSVSAISRWESGIDEPAPRKAMRLCKLLPGLKFIDIYPVDEQGRAAA